MNDRMLAIGIVSTSWWADAMYLPALRNHPRAQITAVCGRNRDRAEQFAERWRIPHVFTSYEAMLDSGLIEALVIASANDTHYPITMHALRLGLHVLCEKPLALTLDQAAGMSALAQAKGVTTAVPFTYRYMPGNRYIRHLLETGYIGRPYHLNMRYYTGYGRTDEFMWRFDASKAGSGALGDIASHFLYLAEWFYGPMTGVFCHLGYLADRPRLNPRGETYERTDDAAIITCAFANGAEGVIHASIMAYEETPFGQTHHMEFHGSEGTIYHFVDWDTVQRVSGARQGEGALKPLAIPDEFWGQARRDTVHHTYKDVFRREGHMVQAFVTAALANRPFEPDFAVGLRVQRLLEAALESHRRRRWIEIE